MVLRSGRGPGYGVVRRWWSLGGACRVVALVCNRENDAKDA